MPVCWGEVGEYGEKVADEGLVGAVGEVAEEFGEFFFVGGREHHLTCAMAEPFFANIEFVADGGDEDTAWGDATNLDGSDGLAFGTELIGEFFLR